MRRPRFIWDDGTPNCLPEWACNEIVRYRLENEDLRSDIYRLRVELAVASGMSRGDALLKVWEDQMARCERLFNV